MNEIEDPEIIKQAYEMRECGMFVSDIAKELSEQTNTKITQISLWRLFNNKEELSKDKKLEDYDYPSRDDIETIFSKLLQKEKNIAFKYRNVNIRRNMMIRILEKYHNKEFTYDEVRIKLNDRYEEEGFYQHFEYLVNNNFIEKVNDTTFKFCDRVKKWKSFGQL